MLGQKKEGGSDERDNCKAACRTCNSRKGTMTAFSFMKSVLKIKPRCLAITNGGKDCKRLVAKGNKKFCFDHEQAKKTTEHIPTPFDQFKHLI